jgi:hypothetical protein
MNVGSVPRCSCNDFRVSCNRCSTTFATTVMCLTDIKILIVTTIAIIFKDILSDFKISVTMTSSYFNLILDC